MNANALRRGHDYAFVHRVRRKVQYIPNAKRCKVLWVYQLESPFKRKRISLVEVQRLQDDGTPDERFPYPVTLEAPQIYTTWEEHVTEMNRHEEKKRKEKEENDRYYAEIERKRNERMERDRLEREKREAIERKRRERIETALSNARIPINNVTIRYDGIHIHIPSWDVERVIQDIEATSQNGDSQTINEGHDQGESQPGGVVDRDGSTNSL